MKSEHIILLYSFIPSKVELKKLINPLGFPDSSVGKESACNAGDLGSIPGFRWSSGEGKDYPPSILVWKIPWTV